VGVDGSPHSSAPDADWQGNYDGHVVNGLVKAIWPLINDFSRQILQDTVTPAVKAALGPMADRFSVDMSSFSLGEKALEIGDLQIGETVQHTTDPEHPEMRVLMVRTPIVWHGHLEVHVSFASVKIGISRLRLEGDLLMELIGSIPRPPLFQGARACFMNAPKIALEYDSKDGALNKLANFGPMKQAILKAVTEQVSNKIVVPNRMGVRLDPECEIFRIIKPRPKGILRVTFTRAEHLLAMDNALFHRATSDPMIKATCGALHFQSPTVSKSTSPIFNYDILLPIDFPMDQKVFVELMDDDTFSSDDSLGSLPHLAVSDLIALGPKEVGYDVLDAAGVPGKNGRLYVKAEWRPLLLADPTMKATPSNSDAAEVFVGVYCAKRLPAGPPGTKYWVTVQCSDRLGLGGHDTTKPRMTAKALEKRLGRMSEQEKAQERVVFKEKHDLCKKYKMSKEDIAALLEVEAEHLDLDEPHENVHHDVDWNSGLDFFISNPHEAVLDVALHCVHPQCETSKEGKDAHDRGKDAHNGYLSRVKKTLQAVPSMASMHTLTGLKDEVVMCIWQIKVVDVMRNPEPCRILEVDGTSTTLHLRLQVRSLGAPSTGAV